MFFTFASLFSAVSSSPSSCRSGSATARSTPDLRLVPWTATFITVAPIAGALADRIGERPLMTLGLTLQALGLGWLALIAAPGRGIREPPGAADRRRRRHFDGDPGGAELRHRLRARPTRSARRRRQQHDAGARWRVRDRRRGRRLRRGGATRPPKPSSTASRPRSASAPCWRSGRRPRARRLAPLPDSSPGGQPMKQVMVRYKVKPELVAENEALVRAVYEELHGAAPRTSVRDVPARGRRELPASRVDQRRGAIAEARCLPAVHAAHRGPLRRAAGAHRAGDDRGLPL